MLGSWSIIYIKTNFKKCFNVGRVPNMTVTMFGDILSVMIMFSVSVPESIMWHSEKLGAKS